MKKGILAIVALGVTASALTGCSALSPAPAPTETVTVTQSAEPVETSEPSQEATESASTEDALPTEFGSGAYTGKVSDTVFTDLVREKTTTAYIMSNYEIVGIAEQTCKTYDTGGDLRNVINDLSEKFLETTSNVKMDEKAFFGDLAFISGAGVANYCGEHEEQFRAEVEKVVEEAKAAS